MWPHPCRAHRYRKLHRLPGVCHQLLESSQPLGKTFKRLPKPLVAPQLNLPRGPKAGENNFAPEYKEASLKSSFL